MKTFYSIISIAFIIAKSFAQETLPILLERNEFSNFSSVIFNKIDPLLNISDTIIPTNKSDIFEFEKNYKHIRKPYKSKDGLINYRRQYFTCILRGRKYLFINFINFGNTNIKKLHNRNFNSELIFGFGELYEANTFRVIYNLEEKTMKVY